MTGASDEPGSGQLSGWLSKKKSGSAVLRMRQYNKRFFVLDFQAREFSYAHAEGSKKSSVVPFSDLVEVRHGVGDTQASIPDDASECSRQSKVSLMRRMSSLTRKTAEEQEQHFLTVTLRPAKQMELLCASAAEAVQWHDAIRSAIDGADGCTAVADTTPISNGGYPSPSAGNRPPVAPQALPTAQAREGEEAEESPPTPPAKKNFLDFGPIGEEDEAAGGVEKEAVVEATGLVTLQAADFGFGADDDRSSSVASSAPSSPRPSTAAKPEAAKGASPAAGGGGYQDRQKGMTLQERLANLDFSDDEDADDDDPLGLKTGAR